MNKSTSASARKLRYIIEQGDWSIDQINLLLEIADMIDTEHNNLLSVNFDQSHTYFKYPQIRSASVILLELFSFITSYVEHGGPCTKSFIQGLYHYLDILDAIFEANEKRLNKLNEIKSILKERLAGRIKK